MLMSLKVEISKLHSTAPKSKNFAELLFCASSGFPVKHISKESRSAPDSHRNVQRYHHVYSIQGPPSGATIRSQCIKGLARAQQILDRVVGNCHKPVTNWTLISATCDLLLLAGWKVCGSSELFEFLNALVFLKMLLSFRLSNIFLNASLNS